MKGIKRTLLYYLVGCISVFVLDKKSPSGPCTIGAGMFAFMLLLLTSIVLFFVNLYKTTASDKRHLGSTLLHLTAILIIYFNG
ncbi:MAG: hypothetical protein QM726_14500 [Chitinophagaceae bacterium]